MRNFYPTGVSPSLIFLKFKSGKDFLSSIFHPSTQSSPVLGKPILPGPKGEKQSHLLEDSPCRLLSTQTRDLLEWRNTMS